MNNREFKDAVFEQFSKVAAAFASPKRIEIIDVLSQGERNVETLARETSMSVANTSRHLGVLKTTGLVASRKEGLQVFYRLSGAKVIEGYHALRSLAEDRIAEIDRLVRDYFRDVTTLETIDKDNLMDRARQGEVVVMDVRPREEYESGHIAGALSVPLFLLEHYMAEVDPKQEIVAYCRGPYCVLAAEAVRRMRARGYKAVRLAEGYPEWREEGLPVESAETSHT